MSNLLSSGLPENCRPCAPDENPMDWARTIPAIQKGVPHQGQLVDVLNLRQRIAVASPSYGFQVFENYFNSYVACKDEIKAHYRMPDGSIQLLSVIAGRLNVPNDSHIDRARNSIANLWDLARGELNTDWLYWWDCDIAVPPPLFARLFWSALEHRIEFLCGCYAMKDLRPTFVANVKPGTKPAADGRFELLDGGTGSMLWHRDVLAKLRAHPEVKPYLCAGNTPFAGKIFWAYFSSGCYGPGAHVSILNDDQRAALARSPQRLTAVQKWESEDWKICRLWQELGGKVYGDSQVKLRHFGGMEFPPRVEEIDDALAHLLDRSSPAIDVNRLRLLLDKYVKEPATAAEAAAAPQAA